MSRLANPLGGDRQQHVDLLVVGAMILGGVLVLAVMMVIATAVLGAP